MSRLAPLHTLLICATLSFSSDVSAQATSNTADVRSDAPTGSKKEPTVGVVSHVVVVVDSTESMLWSNREGQPARISLARQAASLVIDLVPVGTPLSVLALQEDVSAVRPMSPLQAADRHGIRSSIQDLRPKGHGKLSTCFDEVERVLTRNEDGELIVDLTADVRPLVVIITDGDDCEPGVAQGYATVLNSRFRDGMQFSVIGLCTRETIAAGLRSLAKSGSGWYSQLESADGLEAAFSRTRDACHAIRERHRAADRKLAEEHANIVAESSQLTARLGEITTQLDKCLTDGKTKDSQIAVLEQEKATLVREAESLQKAVLDATTQLAESKATMLKLDSEKAELKERVDREMRRADDQAKENLSLVEQSTLLQKEIVSLTATNASLDGKMKTELDSLQKHVGTVEELNSGWNRFANSTFGAILLGIVFFFVKNPMFRGLIQSMGKPLTDKVVAVEGQVDAVKARVEEKVQKLESQVADRLTQLDKQAADRTRQLEDLVRESGKAIAADVGSASMSVVAKVDSAKAKADEIEKAITAVQNSLNQSVTSQIDAIESAITESRNDVKQSVAALQVNVRETVLTRMDSIEKAVSETKTESRQVASENQRTLTEKISAVENAVTRSKDSIVARVEAASDETRQAVDAKLTDTNNGIAVAAASIREAVAEGERSVEAACRESAELVGRKVDAVNQMASGLNADLRQLGSEVRHVSETVKPLATAVVETQAGVQSTSRDIRIELETKLNQFNREVNGTVDKVNGRIEIESHNLADQVRESHRELDRQVKKQVRSLGESVVQQVTGSLQTRLHEHYASQQNELQQMRGGQEQLSKRISQIGGNLDELRTQVRAVPESTATRMSEQVEVLAEDLGRISDDLATLRSEAAQSSSVKSLEDSVSLLNSRLNEVAQQIDRLRENMGTTKRSPSVQRRKKAARKKATKKKAVRTATKKPAARTQSTESAGQREAVRDLRRVSGIGSAFATKLFQAGISTVEALATLSDEKIEEVQATVPTIRDLILDARTFLVRER